MALSFFDTLQGAAGDFAGQEAHQAFGSVLQETPLGGMSGLLDQLKQGGLAEQVEGWCQGQISNVAPEQIQAALGDQHLQQIASSLGISPDEVAGHLAEHLPAMAQAHSQDDGGSDQ